MVDNMYYYELGRSVPDTAKKTIQGGRLHGKTEINPMWRIKKLTEMFGPCGIGWYYRSVREWMETYDKTVVAFVKIELYVKVGGEWSMPIQGTGGSTFVELQKGSPYVSDECFKMATTDAISVACKQLGIGADVYWNQDGTKYARRDQAPEGPKRPPEEPKRPLEEPKRQPEEPKQPPEEPERPPEDPELESLRSQLLYECSRTGIGIERLLTVYRNASCLEDLTKLQLKNALTRMKITKGNGAG